MNLSIIRYILGTVLCFEGLFLLLPVLVSAFYQEGEGIIYLAVAAAAFLAGFAIRMKKPRSRVFFAKEGFAAVTFSWVLMSFVGALPMFLCGDYASYIDALFDTVSGFTTTGASVLSTIEPLAKSTLFWRCFTHWVGGMGVLVFLMAVLPLSDSSDMYLMRAESPGPSVGKLVPRVKQTAVILYKIYFGFTVLQIILLLLAGLPFYDACALTFSTVGTGGFAIVDSSIASYNLAVKIIIIVFMLICSINFNTYYLLLVRKTRLALVDNEELRVFLAAVFISAVLITLQIKSSFGSIGKAFEEALFQVATLVSSTGFATADYNLWPEFSKTVLVLLMLMGACAGSTGGGFKVSRLMILCKAFHNELMTMTHPRSVQKVHMNGQRVEDKTVKTALGYLVAYVLILLTSVLLISLDNFDMTSNFTAVIATLNNIGPGLNVVGPAGNFGGYHLFSKIVLMLDMLVGRLELFPLLVLFAPGMWNLKGPVPRYEHKRFEEYEE